MEHLVDLHRPKGVRLTLIGVEKTSDALHAMGYYVIAPNREREPLPGAPAFLNLSRPKPLRRGCVFRAETGEKFKNTEPLEIDKVNLYAVTLDHDVKFERVP
jgi:hypothetical protein